MTEFVGVCSGGEEIPFSLSVSERKIINHFVVLPSAKQGIFLPHIRVGIQTEPLQITPCVDGFRSFWSKVN